MLTRIHSFAACILYKIILYKIYFIKESVYAAVIDIKGPLYVNRFHWLVARVCCTVYMGSNDVGYSWLISRIWGGVWEKKSLTSYNFTNML